MERFKTCLATVGLILATFGANSVKAAPHAASDGYVAIDTVAFKVSFEVGKSTINPRFRDNVTVIPALTGLLNDTRDNNMRIISELEVSSSVSPEGSYATNQRLIENRAHSICELVWQSYPEKNVVVKSKTSIPTIEQVEAEARALGISIAEMYARMRSATVSFVISEPAALPEPDVPVAVEATPPHRA